MKILDLLYGIDTTELHGADGSVKGIASDSRRVKPGWMFICVRGMRHDGHDYIAEAVGNGACFIVCEDAARLTGQNVGYAVCENTRIAEALIWNNWFGDPSRDMKKIAVTGSNGKTSTVFILREIMRSAGYHTGVITTIRAMADDAVLDMGGNGGSSVSDISGAMTTPDPEYFIGAIAEMKKQGCEVLIYEASSHAIDLHKTEAVRPDVAIFTNLTEEHLDYHGDMERYLEVKSRLFRRAGLGIINADDSYGARLPEMIPETPFIKCSAVPERLCEVDTCALRYQSKGSAGVEYIYFSNLAVFRISTPLICRHSVYNTMLAARCAIELGVDPMTVKDTLSCIRGVDGRMCRVDVGMDAPVSVFIDYAHTPAALESVLKCLCEIRRPKERITVVFGCGGDRDPSKRSKMGAIAQKYADLTVVTSDNSRSEDPLAIIADIVSGMGEGNPYVTIPDRIAAIDYAIESANYDDIILLAGKGHEKYEIDQSGKKPFDEEKIVREAVRRCFGD